ncbi:MAG: hypothetical protein AAGI63_18630 [Planctomycetota bacterium]
MLTVLVCAGSMACYRRGLKIHFAARTIEAGGGDVWLGDTLYSGSGFGNVEPRTSARQTFTQIRVICGLLVGRETELWVASIPENRDEFLANLELLNATTISFDVLGERDRTWINKRLPDVTVSAVCGSYSRMDSVTPLSDIPSVDVPSAPSSQDEFIQSMQMIGSILEANPQLYYRLDRYEPMIGYPTQGEMGRLLDKRRDEIILLPWPN